MPAHADTRSSARAAWRATERTRLGLPRHPTLAGRSAIAVLLGVLGLALLWLRADSRALPVGILVAALGAAAIVASIRARRMPGLGLRGEHVPALVGVGLGILTLAAIAYCLAASVLGLPALPMMA